MFEPSAFAFQTLGFVLLSILIRLVRAGKRCRWRDGVTRGQAVSSWNPSYCCAPTQMKSMRAIRSPDILAGNRNTQDESVLVSLGCYDQLREKLAHTEAALAHAEFDFTDSPGCTQPKD